MLYTMYEWFLKKSNVKYRGFASDPKAKFILLCIFTASKCPSLAASQTLFLNMNLKNDLDCIDVVLMITEVADECIMAANHSVPLDVNFKYNAKLLGLNDEHKYCIVILCRRHTESLWC